MSSEALLRWLRFPRGANNARPAAEKLEVEAERPVPLSSRSAPGETDGGRPPPPWDGWERITLSSRRGPMKRRIRVAIADDDVKVREALSRYLSQERDIELSGDDSEVVRKRALDQGASAFLNKNCGADAVVRTVLAVMQGSS